MGTGTAPSPGGVTPIGPPSLRVSVNLVPLLLTGVRLHPTGRTDKNLCRCFGAPGRRVFADQLSASENVRGFPSMRGRSARTTSRARIATPRSSTCGLSVCR